MRTKDHDGGDGGDKEPEGIDISERLKELARLLGMNQRQLAIYLGVDPRHFNSLWTGKKRAGLPLGSPPADRHGRYSQRHTIIGVVVGRVDGPPPVPSA